MRMETITVTLAPLESLVDGLLTVTTNLLSSTLKVVAKPNPTFNAVKHKHPQN